MKERDCKGLACPGPVVETRKLILEGILPLLVRVDNKPASENVARMARKLGCSARIDNNSDGTYTIEVFSDVSNDKPMSSDSSDVPLPDTGYASTHSPLSMAPANTHTTIADKSSLPSVIYIGSDEMGNGDSRLGQLLMKGFVKTIKDLSPLPSHIIFLNKGIYLTLDDQPATVVPLKQLTDEGVEILVCGTCLDFFNSKEKLAVGRISNMFEIGETLNEAYRVIKP